MASTALFLKAFKMLAVVTWLVAGGYSCGQSGNTGANSELFDSPMLDSLRAVETVKTTSEPPVSFIDTEFTCVDSLGGTIVIQNSFPKGGGDIDGTRGYIDARGIDYGHRIFWTRILNDTDTPLQLAMRFPADSFPVPNASEEFFKLFLPTDSMNVGKETDYNYGIMGLRYFLDTRFDTSTNKERTINPGEQYTFYVVLLIHVPNNGPIRARLEAKETELVYTVSVAPFGSVTIPCGELVAWE